VALYVKEAVDHAGSSSSVAVLLVSVLTTQQSMTASRSPWPGTAQA
jgi:hypothetical protein